MDATEIFAALLGPAGKADPYPLYAALHELGEAAAEPMPGVVIVRGYDAINAVLRDPGFLVMDEAYRDQENPGWREHPSIGMSEILSLNPPRHTRIRKLMTRAFTHRGVAAIEPATARLTAALLDQLADAGADGSPVPFMADFAFQLPVTVICELLGVPAVARAGFRDMGRALTATLEVDPDPSVLAEGDAAAVELRACFTEVAAARRSSPRDDLISALVQVSDADDGRLSDDELFDNLALLLVAGFETTTNLLGNGLRVILCDPAVGDAVRDRTVPAAAFAEEVLRYDSPVQLTSRRRPDPVVVSGLRVPPRADVLTLLGAGNRDPRRFAVPDVFDPLRPDGGPLSFGAGAHFCLGAAWPGWKLSPRSRRCLSGSPASPLRASPSAATASCCAASRPSRSRSREKLERSGSITGSARRKPM
jgi:cytochrome P450